MHAIPAADKGDQIARLRIRKELPMGIDAHGNRKVIRYAQEERIPLFAEVLAHEPEPVLRLLLRTSGKSPPPPSANRG